jgi:lipoprotein-anchoring transpeptidase ErfK/SrfK
MEGQAMRFGTHIWIKSLFAGGLLAVLALQLAGHSARAPVEPAASAAPGRAKVAVTAEPPTTPAPPTPPAAATASALPAAVPDDGMRVKRVLALAGPLRHGDYVWDDAGVPDGPLLITVDLAAETISVFRDGYEIGTAAIVYGADGLPTPLGTFPITQKDANHVSNLYDAPMPYMLRLTSDGVAIHGSMVRWDAATHGCIGVPTEFARKLFAQAKLGDPVIITRGKMLAHPEAVTGA